MVDQPATRKPAPWVVGSLRAHMLHRIALATLSPGQPTVPPTTYPGVRQVTTPGR
jgi:hypothetical protein